MSHRKEGLNLYAILEVPPVASDEQIKAAYRYLVRLHHPDANPNRRAEAEIQIKRIIEAYGILGNAEKRARYDSENRLGALDEAETARYSAHPRAQGEPESLMGRVRWNLGIDSHEFAANLGLADAVLLEMEGRDAVPITPVQKRTFLNMFHRATQKLEAENRYSDAADLRADLRRKDAQSQLYRK